MIRFCPACNKPVVGKPDQRGSMICPKCGGKTQAKKETVNQHLDERPACQSHAQTEGEGG